MDDEPRPPARPPAPITTASMGATPAYALAELLRRAMRTSYGMIARESVAGFEATASLEALLEVLVGKGIVNAEELATAREAAAERIAKVRSADWVGPWLTMATKEQQANPDEIVDCEARHPTCKAACCSFYRVILTEDEVRQGDLLWDLGAPYSLPRGAGGHCAYLDQRTLACTVWKNRPHVCRGYSCAEDKEIWKDFGAVIPTERVGALTRTMARRETKADE